MKNDLEVKKIMWLLVILAVAMGAVIYLVVFVKNKEATKNIEVSKTMEENLGSEASLETQKLINEIKKEKEKIAQVKLNDEDPNNDPVQEEDVVEVVSGASKIDLESGVVVDDNGDKADNSINPASHKAPRASNPISVETAPKASIFLKMTSDKIDSAEFTVKKNQVVSLVVTADDEKAHVFKFKDPSLRGVAIGLGYKETRSIVFNAPNVAGEYTYYDEVGNFESRGAVGKMIVE